MLCENESPKRLPDEVIQAFKELGDMQRDKPERAMLRVQFAMGGGVLNPVVEHVGDITHRMSHMVGYDTVLGYEKVVKTYKWLTSRYGFEREMQQNITNNAKYREVPRAELAEQIKVALQKYAEEHAKLPVYNKVQWLARQAAVFIGLEKFRDAATCLRMILNICPSEEDFKREAMKYSLNHNGAVQLFSPGRHST